MRIGPVLRYPGGKHRLAPWIVAHLPPHRVYVEPCFGSGAVYFAKPKVRSSVLNDIDGEVVNLWRVLREQPEDLARLIALTPWAREEYDASRDPAASPLERARRFLVRSWQSHGQRLGRRSGWRHDGPAPNRSISVTDEWKRLPSRILAAVEPLRDAMIENRPAVDVIRRYAGEHVLVYADPPYLQGTREPDIYAHEMSEAEHEALLAALLAHPGPVVLSGYDSELYSVRLASWTRAAHPAIAEHGERREEVLWLNRPLPRDRQTSLFDTQGA